LRLPSWNLELVNGGQIGNNSRSLEGWLFAAALLVASASSALAAVRYVDVNSASPTPPYTSWSTAATNIQDAVDASVAGDEIVVTNGIYAVGGRGTVGDGTTNRVMVDCGGPHPLDRKTQKLS